MPGFSVTVITRIDPCRTRDAGLWGVTVPGGRQVGDGRSMGSSLGVSGGQAMNDLFQSYLRVPGGGEIERCYYPLKLDTYGRGCEHNCLYCYARSVLAFRNLWDDKSPAIVSVQDVLRTLSTGGDKSWSGRILASKVPLRLGGMTDCFQPKERELGTTRLLLSVLKRMRYPYLILTKNAMVAEPNYLRAMDNQLAYVQMSITTDDDALASRMEPGASSPTDRLKALRVLADAGFYTAARINPLWPTHSDGHFSKGLQGRTFDYFRWTLLDKLADAGVKTVIAGFLRLSNWNLRWVHDEFDDDLSTMFLPETKAANTAYHYSTEEKRYYYERIKKMCDERGMRFSVCYDGDEAYETFRYLWANQNDCCDGLGNVFSTNWQEAFSQ